MDREHAAATATAPPARRLVVADAVLSAGLAALALSADGGTALHLASALAAAGAVAVRRRAPLPALAVAVAGLAVSAYGGPAGSAWLAVALTGYTAAARPLWPSTGVLAATVGAIWAGGALGHPEEFRAHLGIWVFAAASLALSTLWAVSWGLYRERSHHEARRLHAEQRALTAESEARRTVAEERLRLARELHDIVGHSLSIIAVQSGVARHVIAEEPEEAARSLAAIQDTSRSALRELRALLGVLRDHDQVEYTRSGLADLPRLIAESRSAGLDVELTVTGEARPLPPGVDLAAYRIVQEGLTNVVKHSAAGDARVEVAWTAAEVAVAVVDRGPARRAPGAPGAGHGLVGVRERTALYGGRLTAGPTAPRGFRLAATLLTGPAPDDRTTVQGER